jgi:hypothetical protein
MEDVAAMTSASGNEVHLPDTPGLLQDDEDEDLLDESNEFADNLVEELQETDDALLATLHLEREELVSTWRTVVRRMAKKLATLSEANDADTKVKEIDQKIAMVKKLSQSEQPMDEDSTDKAEKKGKNEQLVLKIPPDMPRFDKGSNTRTFLVELRDSITAYVGRDRFERDCQRYLKVLHLGDQAFCEFDVFSEMLVTHLDNRTPDLCQTFPRVLLMTCLSFIHKENYVRVGKLI